MDDLKEAIQVARQAVAATPEDHPDRAKRLNSLGKQLSDRYTSTGAIADLEEAIQVTRQAIAITPEDHPDQLVWLSSLGDRLGNRYLRTGAIADLEEAIQIARQAVAATPENHPDRARGLGSLGNRLGNRYSRRGAMADLEEAIQVTRQAIAATPEDHPDRAKRLNNLGLRLGNRHSRTGAIADLEEAIQVTREAVAAALEDYPDRVKRLNNLGIRLSDRYLRTGAMADLEEAIQVARQAVAAIPKNHPDQAMGLNNLGGRLGVRYLRTGEMADLEEAIQVTRQAVAATPEDHPDRARGLNSLGVRLGNRYSRSGAMADLEEAIQVARQAVAATPEDHPDRPRRLNNLGNRLSNRYLRTEAMPNLKEAIQIARQVVAITPEDHPDRAVGLNNLGTGLGNQYARTGAMTDLEEAIQVARQAVAATPEDHPDRPRRLSSLGNRLSDRHTRTGAMADLEEAIQVARQAIAATPEDHPDRARRLNNLGIRLGNRYSRTEVIADLKEAVLYCQSALRQHNSDTLTRIHAGQQVLRFHAFTSDWEQAYNDVVIAVNLIPRLTLRSLKSSDKQDRLSQAVGLACDAAAVALHAEKEPLFALKLLEQGRGVLAASLEEIRIDVLELQQRHPELAYQFLSLQNELEALVAQNSSSIEAYPDPVTQAGGDRRTIAESRLDELISEIRKAPGFDNFLLPPSEGEMQAAARYGPIVVINISKYRCDALLIEQHQIRSLALPHLNVEEIEENVRQGGLGRPKVLSWLWDVVANPILHTLGFTRSPSNDSYPCVWWIPTGPLIRFPLHAAGHHNVGSTQTVLDRVISSYSSSIKAIIQSRQRRLLEVTPKAPDQALLVAMEHTPGTSRLPSATKEIRLLHEICKSMAINPIEPGKYKQDVLSSLPQSKIFHFAGHGHTHSDDPSQSYLLLQDWKDDKLTVANLLEINLRKHSPFLAYLSACGTGEIRDKRFFDESIHLISAYQLAGFRHVIGTLWEVNDESCLDMARITYEEIRDGGMTDESVCLGLHKAARQLRDSWLAQKTIVGRESSRNANLHSVEDETDSTPLSNNNLLDTRLPRKATALREAPLHWVPYVHYGV